MLHIKYGPGHMLYFITIILNSIFIILPKKQNRKLLTICAVFSELLLKNIVWVL